MKLSAMKSMFNTRPHPGPLPRGEGESLAASLINGWLDSRGAIADYRNRSLAVPSPGGEGQGEGGRHTIQAEPFYVGCCKSS
jgi:hypothetical protein